MKVKLTTVSGSAKELELYLKNPIIKTLLGLKGKGLKYLNIYTNDDDTILLEIECTFRKYLKIQKNLLRFNVYMDLVMKQAIKNKLVRKRYNLDDEKIEYLKGLMDEGVEIDIIKEASANEINESGEGFWTRLKKKFRKTKQGEENAKDKV